MRRETSFYSHHFPSFYIELKISMSISGGFLWRSSSLLLAPAPHRSVDIQGNRAVGKGETGGVEKWGGR